MKLHNRNYACIHGELVAGESRKTRIETEILFTGYVLNFHVAKGSKKTRIETQPLTDSQNHPFLLQKSLRKQGLKPYFLA